MGMSKGWDHIRRPGTGKTWCGLPWLTKVNPAGEHRETCPQCHKRSTRGK